MYPQPNLPIPFKRSKSLDVPGPLFTKIEPNMNVQPRPPYSSQKHKIGVISQLPLFHNNSKVAGRCLKFYSLGVQLDNTALLTMALSILWIRTKKKDVRNIASLKSIVEFSKRPPFHLNSNKKITLRLVQDERLALNERVIPAAEKTFERDKASSLLVVSPDAHSRFSTRCKDLSRTKLSNGFRRFCQFRALVR